MWLVVKILMMMNVLQKNDHTLSHIDHRKKFEMMMMEKCW